MEDIFTHLNDIETFDILDRAGNKTGEIKGYNETHSSGLLHLTVHVWVRNPKGHILLQKRSKYVRVYPTYWDVSAAGHVISPQSSAQAAQLELREELGLDLPQEKFEFLFRIPEFYKTNEGTHIENAFNDVYVVNFDFNVQNLKTEHKEVTEVRFLDLNGFKSWVRGEGEKLVPHQEEYQKLISYLEKLK